MDIDPNELMAFDPEFPNMCDALLACGHFYTAHVASSTFDFPDDPVHCKSCGDLRQLDLRLQAKIVESWT